MKYSAVIVAAGSGSRTGLEYNKVFYKINDRTVIEHSVQHFIEDDECKEIIIVINEVEENVFKSILKTSKIKFVKGGEERKDSVYRGLQAVSLDYVMIHDGARPFLKRERLEEIKKVLKNYEATLLMVPSVDTNKIVKDGLVIKTLERSEVYNAQTPQAFKTTLIKDAYDKLMEEDVFATDDISVIEQYARVDIKVIIGDYSNIKITTKEDL